MEVCEERIPGFVILLILCFLISQCGEKKELTEDRSFALDNKIKSIYEYKTDYSLSSGANEYLAKQIHYAENGLRLSETSYRPDSSIEVLTEYVYDAKENNISIIDKSPGDAIICRIEKTYDENGLQRDYTFFLPDSSIKFKNTTVHGADGKPAELHWFRSEGFISRNKYQYENGKIRYDMEYDKEGNLQYCRDYRYNSKGKLVEMLQYFPDSSIGSRVKYDYSIDRLLARETEFHNESVTLVNYFTYNRHRLLTGKTSQGPTGRIINKCRYEYEYY